MDPKKCIFPNCREQATMTWALVDLCDEHHDGIKAETEQYYKGISGKAESVQRPLYFQIRHLIPWSKGKMKAGDRK